MSDTTKFENYRKWLVQHDFLESQEFDYLDSLDLSVIICANADNLLEFFGKEIDTIYLTFSEPWPKKQDEKRRIYIPVIRRGNTDPCDPLDPGGRSKGRTADRSRNDGVCGTV